MPTAKRLVTKPPEEKFVPPVAEVVPELKVPVVAPIVVEAKPTQIKWGLFYGGLLLLVLVIGFSGGLWWGYRQGWGMVSVSPSPTPVVQATPTPVPEVVVIDKALIRVDVLNGTGVAGKAGTIATKIVELGYAKGKTGNAKAQVGTTLELSGDLASMSTIILSDMQGVVVGATLTTTALTGTSSARLVLGSE